MRASPSRRVGVGELPHALGGQLEMVALPRGHGNVVVGRSIKEAVFRAVYTEVNARLASKALRLGTGEAVFLNEDEAKAAADTDSAQIGRPWELWKKALVEPR